MRVAIGPTDLPERAPRSAMVTKNIGPGSLTVLREVGLPVRVDQAWPTELRALRLSWVTPPCSWCVLQWSSRDNSLWQKSTHQAATNLGCTLSWLIQTVLESGCDTVHLRHSADGDMILNLCKGIIEKHCVLVVALLFPSESSTLMLHLSP